ncbi:hypothetical protein [Rhizobium sp. BK251]|uniref:hypothetical protein n=1 Tax=Rhizobium sp. BK251 TaxID=2512125 RepID=UPI0010ED060B|nr:hypothetical protein [Rhizobium sp. BK251]TCL72075.1 hypothetical protein EV286_105336 [Rhizobium sp. BK251]
MRQGISLVTAAPSNNRSGAIAVTLSAFVRITRETGELLASAMQIAIATRCRMPGRF